MLPINSSLPGPVVGSPFSRPVSLELAATTSDVVAIADAITFSYSAAAAAFIVVAIADATTFSYSAATVAFVFTSSDYAAAAVVVVAAVVVTSSDSAAVVVVVAAAAVVAVATASEICCCFSLHLSPDRGLLVEECPDLRVAARAGHVEGGGPQGARPIWVRPPLQQQLRQRLATDHRCQHQRGDHGTGGGGVHRGGPDQKIHNIPNKT